ncbi:MAG TPA: preprotein translocase subunit SecA [Erysipelothrix sp.]|nr:preprotein translocase subunit SecA [Erysipelothrix sp.]
MGFLKRAFTDMFSYESKRLKEIDEIVNKIENLKATMEAKSDEQLREMTDIFKERLKSGETLDDILVEAFAVVREAARRVINEYPYRVQLIGGIVLNDGDIAEMKTGEGKTLTSVMPVYLNALEGKGVHVVTVNDYLAKRDAGWMGEIHRFLGLSVAFNHRGLNKREKREVYAADITYTTNSELGFDYLRDNMVTSVDDRVMRGLNFALVDEVDSILVDESRTPLIISGGHRKTANLYEQADKFVKRLKNVEDFDVDIKSKTVQLNESGVEKAESFFRIDNLYDVEHTNTVHHINMALKANYTMSNEVEYVVRDDEIIIVDQFTGRMMEGRAFSDGLHQAIEAKENVTIKEETSTLATITYQNFFRLYNKLSGMTGTAKTEEEEFLSIYNMRTIEIPTNVPIMRQDLPDLVYGTQKAKFNALIDKIVEINQTGQPILVGTISVETSEFVSKMLKQRRIRHQVLNAKFHEREADIIARAGFKGSVTIATNMAGRGTDIKINDEVRALGGLAVLGSERHESRRIDNQLRGRAGRQGDPGMSQFFVSMEDELMVRFGSDRFAGLSAELGDTPIESKMFTNAIGTAQKRVEGHNFDIRKSLLEYDDVLAQQRATIYQQRDYILENEDIHSIVKEMFDITIGAIVNNNYDIETSEINYKGIIDSLELLGFDGIIKLKTLEGLDNEEVRDKCVKIAWNHYEQKTRPVKEQVLVVERNVVLRIVDRQWMDHIDTMSHLREGIHLRSYAQSNPLQQYIEEGYNLFESMMHNIAVEVVQWSMRVKVK